MLKYHNFIVGRLVEYYAEVTVYAAIAVIGEKGKVMVKIYADRNVGYFAYSSQLVFRYRLQFSRYEHLHVRY